MISWGLGWECPGLCGPNETDFTVVPWLPFGSPSSLWVLGFPMGSQPHRPGSGPSTSVGCSCLSSPCALGSPAVWILAHAHKSLLCRPGQVGSCLRGGHCPPREWPVQASTGPSKGGGGAWRVAGCSPPLRRTPDLAGQAGSSPLELQPQHWVQEVAGPEFPPPPHPTQGAQGTSRAMPDLPGVCCAPCHYHHHHVSPYSKERRGGDQKREGRLATCSWQVALAAPWPDARGWELLQGFVGPGAWWGLAPCG